MRFFLLTLFAIALQHAGITQATTDYLLWHKGKLLRPNVLLTPTGDTLRFNPATGVLKAAPAKGGAANFLNAQETELASTAKRIREAVQHFSTVVPKPALPLLAQQIKQGYEAVQNRYQTVLRNSLQLPAPVLPPLEKPGKGGGDGYVDFYQMLRDSVMLLNEYVTAHGGEVFLDLPEPPKQQFTYCSPCQPELEQAYNRELETMIKTLMGEDHYFLQRVFNLSRSAALVLTGEQNQFVQTACSEMTDFVMKRTNQKARLMWEKYGKDPRNISALLTVIFSVERENQLLGCSQPANLRVEKEVRETMIEFIHQALDARDYTIALNFQLFLSLDRTCQLLLGNGPANWVLFERAMKFNRFRMDIHISGKLGTDDGYQLAELKAKNWFLAIPDTACRLRWILIEPLVNKMRGEIVGSDWRGKNVVINYAGPKAWNSEIPKMRLDFCKPDESLQDTVDIYQFDAEGFDEKWNIPKLGVTKVLAMNNPLMTCFLDLDALKQEAQEFKMNPAAVEKMKKQAAKLQAMAKNNQLQSMDMGGKLNFQTVQMMVSMQELSREVSEVIHQSAPNKYHFEPTLHNRDAVIVKEKLNGQTLNPQNSAIQYAWFFLTLEHDPDGPLGAIL